jgi:hypothetical protein
VRLSSQGRPSLQAGASADLDGDVSGIAIDSVDLRRAKRVEKVESDKVETGSLGYDSTTLSRL